MGLPSAKRLIHWKFFQDGKLHRESSAPQNVYFRKRAPPQVKWLRGYREATEQPDGSFVVEVHATTIAKTSIDQILSGRAGRLGSGSR